MRHRILALCLIVLATPLFGRDLYLSIGGTAGAFHTDMRIFNPSYTKDIQVQATMLGVGNADNSGAQPKTITVPKRQMLVYNDVLASLFNAPGVLGGLRLKSDDDFVVTQRIYALAADGSTTGQYIPGLDVSTAKKKGLIIQLRNNGAAGQVGTFRTNVGAVNPNAVAATVTWRLYDKNNLLVGQPMTQTMPPFAVIAPTSVGAFATGAPAGVDLSDAWISFESDQPLFAYASVVDNATADGTLIPNFEDTGVQPPVTPPSTDAMTFLVTLRSGQIVIDHGFDAIRPNDVIKFRIHSEDVEHGFRVTSPIGAVLTDRTYKPSDGTVEVTVTIPREGTYAYTCTITTCSTGHNSMYGTFIIGTGSTYEKPGYN